MNGHTDLDLSLHVAAAFDTIAERFDEELENNITRRIRGRIYSTIEDLVRPGASVLDMNCGTGIDAIALSLRGYDVTGIDISSKMVQQARRKASRARLHGIRFLIGSFEGISELVDPPFDLVLSNFGGLNCTGNLSAVALEVARVIAPSGFLLAVVMPPFSLWESLSYAVRGQWGSVMRRLRSQATATGFDGKTFIVHYYAPTSSVQAFRPWFDVKRITGICALAPTPQSSSFARRHPKLTRGLETLDSLIGGLPLVRSIGDHYMIVLERRPSRPFRR